MSTTLKAWLGVLGALVVALFVVLVWALLLRGPGGVSHSATPSPEVSDTADAGESASPEPESSTSPTAEQPSPSPSESASPVLAPIPEGALVLPEFASPSGNLQCRMDEQDVLCGVVQADWTPPGVDRCETAARAVVLSETGVSAECAGAAPVAPDGGLAVLEYGRTSAVGTWLCTSSERGMECTSRADGTGFTIARATFTSYGPGRLM